MPKPLTRTVETKITEDQEVSPNPPGLGGTTLEYLAKLPDDQLELTSVKLYRLEPATQGQTGYFKKIGWGTNEPCERIDEDWIASRWGGGVYRIRVQTKEGPCGFDQVTVAGPPKLLPNQATYAAPANGGPAATGSTDPALVQLLEKLIDRIDSRVAPAPTSTAAQDAGIGVVAEAAKQGFAILAEQLKRPAGGEKSAREEIGELLGLMKALKPEESDLDKAVKAAMIKKLTEGDASQSKDLLAQVKALAEIGEFLGWNRGAGGGKFGWADLGQTLLEKGPEILDRLGNISRDRVDYARARAEQATATAAAAKVARDLRRETASPPGPSGLPPRPTPVPTAPAPDAGLPMSAIDGSAPPAGGPPSIAPGINTESDSFVQYIKARIVEMIREGAGGDEIVIFLNGNRQQKFVDMIERFPAEQITAYLKHDAILREAAEDPDWPDVLREAKEYVARVAEEVAAAAPPAPPARPN